MGMSHGHSVLRENCLEFLLVGSMLLNPTKIGRVAEIVTTEDFDEELAREFFEKTVDCFHGQNVKDTGTLVESLQATGMTKPKLHFLFKVVGSFHGGEEVMELAELVRNKSIFRRLAFEAPLGTE